jgi:hypothetical protein
MKNSVIKLVGVSYGDAQENIKLFGCKDVGSFAMVREPENAYDSNAIRVELGGKYLGYIPKRTAKYLEHQMDAGRKFIAKFISRNESPFHDTVGLTVEVVEYRIRKAA